ncbi:MAG: DUF308 domain-containing protein [Blautia sp.]|nr:DUF308 domain-containing protein [Blautia sp.]
MKRFLETMRRSWVLSAILTVLLGGVLIAYPADTSRVFCYCVGAAILAHGIFDIVRYCTGRNGEFFFRYDLIAGIVLCAAGIFMLFSPEIVMMMIPIIMGLYIIIDGAANIRRSIEMRRLGFSKWWLGLLTAVLTVALGGVMLWNPFAAAEVTAIFIGSVLVYQGIMDLIFFFCIGRGRRKLKKILESEALE